MLTPHQRDFELSTWENGKIFAHSWLPDSPDVKDIIVLIHGLGEHLGRYNHWALKFCNEGFGVYALDMIGHGRSAGKRGHVDSFDENYESVSKLLESVHQKHPNAKIHLYGHSMGGAVVLGSVISRNLKASTIIVTGPAIAPGFEPPAWKISLAKFLDQILPGLVLGNELDINGISRDPAVVEAYKKDPLVHSKLSVRWFNEWLRCVDMIKRQVIEIKVPVLIMHGAEDKLTSPTAAEQLSKSMKTNTTFKLWPNGFHEIHNEPDKDDVFQYVVNWIRKSA